MGSFPSYNPISMAYVSWQKIPSIFLFERFTNKTCSFILYEKASYLFMSSLSFLLGVRSILFYNKQRYFDYQMILLHSVWLNIKNTRIIIQTNTVKTGFFQAGYNFGKFGPTMYIIRFGRCNFGEYYMIFLLKTYSIYQNESKKKLLIANSKLYILTTHASIISTETN